MHGRFECQLYFQTVPDPSTPRVMVLPASVVTKICMLGCCSAVGAVEAVPAWMLFGSCVLCAVVVVGQQLTVKLEILTGISKTATVCISTVVFVALSVMVASACLEIFGAREFTLGAPTSTTSAVHVRVSVRAVCTRMGRGAPATSAGECRREHRREEQEHYDGCEERA